MENLKLNNKEERIDKKRRFFSSIPPEIQNKEDSQEKEIKLRNVLKKLKEKHNENDKKSDAANKSAVPFSKKNFSSHRSKKF